MSCWPAVIPDAKQQQPLRPHLRLPQPDTQLTFTPQTKEAVLSTLGTTVLLALAMHTLGAPVAMYLRTLLFAFHLALLTAYPIIATLGFPDLYDAGIAARFRLTRLVCEWRAEDARERALAFPLAGALVGAWVGAIPLALDWDRPWQVSRVGVSCLPWAESAEMRTPRCRQAVISSTRARLGRSYDSPKNRADTPHPKAWPLIPLVTSILGFVAGSWASFATSALESLRKEIADDQAANAPKPVAKKRKGKKSA